MAVYAFLSCILQELIHWDMKPAQNDGKYQELLVTQARNLKSGNFINRVLQIHNKFYHQRIFYLKVACSERREDFVIRYEHGC
jgi:hypothetical protein